MLTHEQPREEERQKLLLWALSAGGRKEDYIEHQRRERFSIFFAL